MYECKNLHHYYYLDHQKIHALQEINLSIPSGNIMCLAGPSGSGKTTLLNLLGLIEPVQKGILKFQNEDCSKMNEKRFNQIRKYELGFIFQNFHLFNALSAFENVEYFLISQRLNKKNRHYLVEKALKQVGLWEYRQHTPLQLSGGQKQRVAIARAVAKRPKVILADEPTASLDQKTGHMIMEILKDLNRQEGVCIVVCSHDQMVISSLPNTIYLEDGLIKHSTDKKIYHEQIVKNDRHTDLAIQE